MWNYFSKLDKIVQCNSRKEYKTSHLNDLKVHLIHVHKISDDEDNLWKNNTNDIIWRYFSKLDGYAAQYNVAHCKKLFQFAHVRMNLMRTFEKVS